MPSDSAATPTFPQVSALRQPLRGRSENATNSISATPPLHSPTVGFLTEGEFGTTGEVDAWKHRWLLSKPSARTRETYSLALDRWLDHCAAADVHPWLAEPHHVDSFRAALPGAPSTVAGHLSAVSSFYRLVIRRARPCPVPFNPAADVDRPKVDTASRRDGLDTAGALALQDAAAAHSPRTAALVHLLLGTALRVSEAVNATVDGLGWDEDGDRTLQVVRKGGRPDVVVIEAGDWAVIDRYLQERPSVPNGWLFATTGGRRMTRQTAYDLIRRVADPLTGPGKRIGAHSLRHSAATIALDAGIPIQEVQGMLRHSSPATTQRYDRSARQRGRKASKAVARAREAS